ncbi:MAG: trigger factor [Armatimonadetes bacterium]|nr:trigger factor [Armatimonadota bacterium]
MFAIVQPEPGSRARLAIHVEQKHVDRAYRTLFEDLVNRGNIPGFRKGKVPIWRIRREYGPKAIDGAVYGDLMEQALRCVLTYGRLHPLGPADFEDEEDDRLAKESQPLVSDRVVLPLRPEVRVPKAEGLELKTPEIEPSEDELAAELKRLQDAAVERVAVERKEVRAGDQVEVVLRTQAEGEEGDPEEQDASLIVGEDRYDPPVDTHLVGHSVGETVEFTIEYPDRPGLDRLAGKTVRVAADIKDVCERKVPALDDEFAKQAIEGCETLEALRAEVTVRLRREHEELAQQVLRGQAIRWLGDNLRVDLPESFLELSDDEDEEDGEELTLPAEASRALSVAFACEALLAERGVEVSEDEVRQAYLALGVSRGVDASLLIGDRIDRSVATMLRERIVNERAGDLIAESATKQTVPLSDLAEELTQTAGEAGHEPGEPTEDPTDD